MKVEPKKRKRTAKSLTKLIKKTRPGRVKWRKLKHNGPMFPPKYKPLPRNVSFKYNNKRFKLNRKAEEVATLYAKMLKEKYVKNVTFNENFMRDWRETMTSREQKKITYLEKCNFTEITQHFEKEAEAKKKWSKEKKQREKRKREKLEEKYAWCMVDGKKQKIGNYKVEPPGLFRGRGNHPKMGTLKKRITPNDVTINLSTGCKVPKPSVGGKWREVVHNNTVTWLACWFDDISNTYKYVFLSPSSTLREEGDIAKFELSRALHKYSNKIKKDYMKGMKSDCPVYKQTSVALYFIDRLALRVGNEKGKDQVDTIGCCSLRKEHINLRKMGRKCVVSFHFLSKDSMEYKNTVEVEPLVFKAIQELLKGKGPKHKLFDEITPASLNEHLHTIMEGLSAKVFRTYNASKVFEEQLKVFTKKNMNMIEKVRAYEQANREVAVLCNHRRMPPKNFDKRTKQLKMKIGERQKKLKKLRTELDDFRDFKEELPNEKSKRKVAVKQRMIKACEEQLEKLINTKEKHLLNKHIALSTSKLNYCDPRISVAWCKKYKVHIDRIFTKTQRAKFEWAFQMTKANFKYLRKDS
nr:DNA topoisomerase 1-like [Parasteatoda tepidariorum]